MSKELYHFEDAGKVCRITDPKPPRYWFNYLWSEKGYCAQISQMGHGRSYYLNEKADICMINNNDARYIFLRDEDSGDVWNIGAGTALEHLKAAVDCLLRDKGTHGLVKLRFADGNDALNITTDPDAESVMLSHQFALALKAWGLLEEGTGYVHGAAEKRRRAPAEKGPDQNRGHQPPRRPRQKDVRRLHPSGHDRVHLRHRQLHRRRQRLGADGP